MGWMIKNAFSDNADYGREHEPPWLPPLPIAKESNLMPEPVKWPSDLLENIPIKEQERGLDCIGKVEIYDDFIWRWFPTGHYQFSVLGPGLIGSWLDHADSIGAIMVGSNVGLYFNNGALLTPGPQIKGADRRLTNRVRSGRFLNVAYAPHLVMEYVHISQLQWYVHKVFHRYFSYTTKAGSRVDEVLNSEGAIDQERGDIPEVDLEPELTPPAASVGLYWRSICAAIPLSRCTIPSVLALG